MENDPLDAFLQEVDAEEPPAKKRKVEVPNHKAKTKLCRNFAQWGSCRYGDQCKFAHGGQELRRDEQQQPRIPAANVLEDAGAGAGAGAAAAAAAAAAGAGAGAGAGRNGGPQNAAASAFEGDDEKGWVSRREGSSNSGKRCIRMAGGRTWEDKTLDDWPEDDFRLFIGNLANDVNDVVLTAAFSPFTSFLKAKVIRAKHDNKSKGYGFVSFGNPFECAKAMRAMEGRYVGSRPVKIKKSNWQERNIGHVRRQDRS